MNRPDLTEKMSSQTVLSHYQELRGILILSALSFILCTLLCFVFFDQISQILMAPYSQFVVSNNAFVDPYQYGLKSLSPSETLLVSFKLSVLWGFIISLPVIVGLLWKFIRPGLSDVERHSLKLIVILSPILFFCGMVFCYICVVPLALRFLWNYSIRYNIVPYWTFSYYIDFVSALLLAFGVVFETPLLIVLLTKTGFIKVEDLAAHRKLIIVIILILAAFLTPPDVVSQVLLAVPLMALFEGSLIFAKLFNRKDKKTF